MVVAPSPPFAVRTLVRRPKAWTARQLKTSAADLLEHRSKTIIHELSLGVNNHTHRQYTAELWEAAKQPGAGCPAMFGQSDRCATRSSQLALLGRSSASSPVQGASSGGESRC